ncbi:hypothetical protein P8625_08020 [Tenacibaculum tangerinum]|uniref:PepSY domain-containing protein n=1 Tax=Tenacibaculum tangerinum TaxID=3038772 RepID=A0ABY8KXU2_9FLAO|nr:hypothetical protein [Tenacibaculum tangerinum]WGH74067.1 hypothetical protein P8625_08020 [Tenacibaculum tangerinum]
MKCFVIIYFAVVVTSFSQQKFEKEYKIKLNEVPLKAKSFINKCDFDARIKWYAEESQDGKTIEAKFCKDRHVYSIEFDEKGNLLDVERKIKWRELAVKRQQAIKKTLNNHFKKYKIKKIQEQWLTEQESCIGLAKENLNSREKVLYEIVIKGKKNATTELFEILMTGDGTLIKELEFAPQNNDNLEF